MTTKKPFGACVKLIASMALWVVSNAQAAPAPGVRVTPAGEWPAWARGPAKSVAISGPYAYVALGASLQVLDVTQPSGLVRAGGCNRPADDVVVSGQFAYAAFYSGVQIFDVSDPFNPRPVGSFQTEGGNRQLALAGQYVYVADVSSGLHVIDVSNPANPVLTRVARTLPHDTA
jgi:hypothetical protein